jgi:hypothetical protein
MSIKLWRSSRYTVPVRGAIQRRPPAPTKKFELTEEVEGKGELEDELVDHDEIADRHRA